MKFLDFDISKIEVKSILQISIRKKKYRYCWIYSTSSYKNNVFEKSLLEVDALKEDVFSSSLIYRKIIIFLKKPFGDECLFCTYPANIKSG